MEAISCTQLIRAVIISGRVVFQETTAMILRKTSSTRVNLLELLDGALDRGGYGRGSCDWIGYGSEVVSGCWDLGGSESSGDETLGLVVDVAGIAPIAGRVVTATVYAQRFLFSWTRGVSHSGGH